MNVKEIRELTAKLDEIERRFPRRLQIGSIIIHPNDLTQLMRIVGASRSGVEPMLAASGVDIRESVFATRGRGVITNLDGQLIGVVDLATGVCAIRDPEAQREASR